MITKLLLWLRVKIWDPIWNKTVTWLNTEKDNVELPPNDFKQLCYEIRPGDVILVEGRSHVAEVIKLISQSPWTHSALYIGHLCDIKDSNMRQQVEHNYHGDPKSPLVIEALLGEGTVVHPIEKYHNDHLRICRPSGITPKDAQKVIEFGIDKLGNEYHVRQLLDLARFLFPYSLLPKRWRSSLFMHNTGSATRTVCSSMISEAFQQIQFPIVPVTERLENGHFSLYMRNPRLITPKDFDYSPYFEIIKYPIYGFDHIARYKKMPWNEEGIICHEPGDCYLPGDVMASSISPDGHVLQKINLLKQAGHIKIKKYSKKVQQTKPFFANLLYSMYNFTKLPFKTLLVKYLPSISPGKPTARQGTCRCRPGHTKQQRRRCQILCAIRQGHNESIRLRRNHAIPH